MRYCVRVAQSGEGYGGNRTAGLAEINGSPGPSPGRYNLGALRVFKGAPFIMIFLHVCQFSYSISSPPLSYPVPITRIHDQN